MQGGSYLGQNQWRAAQAAPPALVTIFPMVASTSIYHDWITLNGGWRLSFNFGWGPVRMESRIMQNPGPHSTAGVRAMHYDQVQWHLPLNTMQQVVGRKARFYDDWLANPDYNDYWKPLNVEEMFDRIAIPVHTLGGWFDIFSQGTLRGYVGMSQKGATEQARRMSHLVIGPWGHGPSQKTGALDFGADANVDALAIQLRWYDYFLKGIDNGLDERAAGEAVRDGPERMGVRARVSAGQDDLSSAVSSRAEARANSDRGDGRLTWEKPTDGRVIRSLPLRSRRSGAVGRRQQLLRHADLRRSAGSAADRGPPRRPRLHVGLPRRGDRGHRAGQGGAARVVRRGGHRLRGQAGGRLSGRRELQHGRGHPARPLSREPQPARLLKPGEVYRLEIDLVGTSVAFRKGHRIRVHVTSSHFPQFDRNPNTGAPFGTTSEVRVAQQTVYHDATRPSHILLPVIPPRIAAAPAVSSRP